MAAVQGRYYAYNPWREVMFKKRPPVVIPVLQSEIELDLAMQEMYRAQRKFEKTKDLLEEFITDFKTMHRAQKDV